MPRVKPARPEENLDAWCMRSHFHGLHIRASEGFSKTIFHRPEATEELKNMESLFLKLLRLFHIRQPARVYPDESRNGIS